MPRYNIRKEYENLSDSEVDALPLPAKVKDHLKSHIREKRRHREEPMLAA